MIIDITKTLISRFHGKKPTELKDQDKADYFKIVAAFMREPTTLEFSSDNTRRIQSWMAHQQVQGWTDKSDFPSGESFYPMLPAISALPFYDEGFKEFFKVLDFTGSGKGGFRQLLLENTIEFNLVPSGDKAVIYNVKGSKETIDFDKYGAGLEWDKILLEDAEWAQIADILSAFRNAGYQNYAQVHYDALTYIWDAANPAVKADIAWQNPDPAALPNTSETYTANRDIETINNAAGTIALACRDKGYGITPQSTFVVFTPLQLRGRVRRALGLGLQAFAGSPLHLDYNVRQVTTMMMRVPTTGVAVTDHYVVAFPGARAQSGMRLNLEELTEENIQARSTLQVDWMRFGCGIGDTDQVERCNIA
jgi:hypothetical protein